jgi:hypothetical protein
MIIMGIDKSDFPHFDHETVFDGMGEAIDEFLHGEIDYIAASNREGTAPFFHIRRRKSDANTYVTTLFGWRGCEAASNVGPIGTISLTNVRTTILDLCRDPRINEPTFRMVFVGGKNK